MCSGRDLKYKALLMQGVLKGKAIKTLIFRKKVYFTVNGVQCAVGIICTNWKNKSMVNEIVSL